MASTPRATTRRAVDYPTSDGRPMAETDLHRQGMMDLIEAIQARYAADPMCYVTGNLLLFYEEGNRRRHVSPDVMVAFDRPKLPPRDYYLLWEEGKAPDVVIELTSKTTRREDQRKKWVLYRDVLKVPEYFLFDPTSDWLKPSPQGFRLVDGDYVPIEMTGGDVLPSAILGLGLVRRGQELRLFEGGRMLLTPREQVIVEQARADAERRIAEAERVRADDAEAQVARLLREIEAMRRPGGNGA